MQINDTTLNTAGDANVIDGAITEVKTPDASLAVLKPAEYAVQLFKPFNDELAKEKRSAARVKFDITTKAGFEKAKELQTTFVKIRTGAEKAKTKAKKPIDQAGKEILTQYNALEAAAKVEEKKYADAIEAEKKRLADIDAEKQRLERVRIEAIESRIDDIRLIPSTLAKADAATIEAKLGELVARALDEKDFEEHLEVAITAQNTSINELRQLLTDARASEARDAELERLRAAEAERETKAKAEREAQEATAAAQKRQLEEAQAAAAKSQQISEVILKIQQCGMLEGDVRTLHRTLVDLEAIVVDEATFGSMMPMASMAKDMAANTLRSKYGIQLEAELSTAWDAALDEDAQRAHLTGQSERLRAYKAPSIIETAPAASPLEQVRRSFDLPGSVKAAERPSDLAIVQHLALKYDVPASTVLNWLATLDVQAVRNELSEV